MGDMLAILSCTLRHILLMISGTVTEIQITADNSMTEFVHHPWSL